MKGLPLHGVLGYFITVNVLGLVLVGIDKRKAKHDKWRISEATLLSVTAIGGSIGAWVGMKVWHHKTMHKKFKYGIPLVIVLQFVLLLFTLYWLNSI